MRRIPVVIAIGSTLCLMAPTSHALTFGRVDNTTVLGQPLDFSATVNASTVDEAVGGECLAAEVFAGDSRLPQPLVRIRLESSPDGRQANVRVTTTVRIDEPIVTVNLMVGCPVKLARRFVAFVDPPVIALPLTTAAANPDPVSNPRAEPPRDAPPTTAAPSARAASTATPRIAPRPPKRPPMAVVAAAPPRPRPNVTPPRSSGTAASAAGAAPANADRSASTPSRLVLDSAPASSSAAPFSPAASAILAAELESYAQELAVERQRLKALEESVDRMRRENEATRTSLARVQSQLHDADAAKGVPGWLYGLIALLVAVIAGLVWRQSRLKRQARWWGDSHEPATVAPLAASAMSVVVPDVEAAEVELPELLELPQDAASIVAKVTRSNVRVADDVTTPAMPLPLLPNSDGPLPMRDAPPPRPRGKVGHFDTQPMPPGTFTRASEDSLRPTRELSVEELIDIEQQADFFVVLGQDDAAIDMLMGLVRSSGGQSPMPYLKLLEIYRRLDQRDAYDRIRERFNQRFNASAPPLDIDPALGLDLTGYPDTLGRLQAAWAQPQQVVTVIERLMPKSSAEGDTFDLEAFSDMLFLMRIARDLSDLERGEHGVDFLLPLDSDPLIVGPATLSLHAPYEPHKPMVDLTLDLDLDLDPHR